MPDPVESRGRGDTSFFGSLATLSHTLLGWDQLPTSTYTKEERGLISSYGPAHTSSLNRHHPTHLSNVVQPTVFVPLPPGLKQPKPH